MGPPTPTYADQSLDDLLTGALTRLAVRRPVFHSEEDFQFELAWEVRTLRPDCAARLELPFRLGTTAGTMNLDLLVRDPAGQQLAVELKYIKTRWTGEVAGEAFHLADSYVPEAGYDVIKDINRIERITAATPNTSGAVVTISHADLTWRDRDVDPNRHWYPFRIAEGVALGGNLAWPAHTKPGSIGRDRLAPIALAGEYTCHWQPYSIVGEGGAREVFKTLRFDIPQPGASPIT